MNDKTLNDKIRGSLIGGAIGDALGYPIEFKKNIKEKEITRFKDDVAVISDDTQMTLFTANSLLWRETRGALRGIAMSPTDAIYLGYKDWLNSQNNKTTEDYICWIKNIKELNVSRAPGNTCISALLSGIKGTIEKPINDSKGCGGVMRVAPIGLYMKNPENAGLIAAEASAITHGHPLGIIPSYVFSTLLYYIVREDLSIKEALDISMTQFKNKFQSFDKKYNDYFAELVQKAIELSEQNISDIEAISQLGDGWVAEEAFAIAIYSCLKYNNFEDAIVCSVNHDGDSDSTGAIAGNIVGAYVGYNKIPNYYKNNVELKAIILEISDDLSQSIPVSEYSNNNDEYWLSKYLYRNRNVSLKK